MTISPVSEFSSMVPPGFTQVLKDLIKGILLNQPKNIANYCHSHFVQMQTQGKNKKLSIDEYSSL